MMHRFGKFACTASFAVLISQPAFAMDGATLIAGLKAQAELSGGSLEVGTIEEIGPDSFRLSDLEFSGKGVQAPLKLKSVEVIDAKEIAGKSVMIGSLKFNGISFSGKTEKGHEVFVTVDDSMGSNLYMADPQDLDAPLFPFDRMEYKIGRISVNVDGWNMMSVSGITSTTEKTSGQNAFNSTMTIPELAIDLSRIEDPKAKAQIQALGLETLKIAVRLDGSFNLDTGRMELKEYSFDAADAGRLNTTIAIDGYDMALVRKMREASLAASKAGNNDPEAQKAAAAQLMGVLAELKLAGATVSFDDQSIVGKVLDIQSAAMGVTREELAQMAPVMAMGMTQALDNPEFSAMVGAALAKFGSDPKSLTVTFAPPEPVAFAQIVGTAIAGPAALLGLLGVTVKANE